MRQQQASGKRWGVSTVASVTQPIPKQRTILTSEMPTRTSLITSFSTIFSTISCRALCIITSCAYSAVVIPSAVIEHDGMRGSRTTGHHTDSGSQVAVRQSLTPTAGQRLCTTARNRFTHRSARNHLAVVADHDAPLRGLQLGPQGADLVLELAQHRVLKIGAGDKICYCGKEGMKS
jgi:hypothetical protein